MQGKDSGQRLLQPLPLLLLLSTHSALLENPIPVVRQICHKSGTKDQDDGKTKEEDSSHVPDVHHRVLVIAVKVWVLRRRKDH